MQMVIFDPMMCATDSGVHNHGSAWKTVRLLQFMSNWALVLEIKNVLGYNTLLYVNVKCHILLNFIIFLYAYTCKCPPPTCRLYTVAVDFSHEILKMLFSWPNHLPHLPYWSLCPHTILTYIFSFSDILERSSTPFVISFFQNNSISLGAQWLAIASS